MHRRRMERCLDLTTPFGSRRGPPRGQRGSGGRGSEAKRKVVAAPQRRPAKNTDKNSPQTIRGVPAADGLLLPRDLPTQLCLRICCGLHWTVDIVDAYGRTERAKWTITARQPKNAGLIRKTVGGWNSAEMHHNKYFGSFCVGHVPGYREANARATRSPTCSSVGTA
jgi:hypothetical protein